MIFIYNHIVDYLIHVISISNPKKSVKRRYKFTPPSKVGACCTNHMQIYTAKTTFLLLPFAVVSKSLTRI